MAPERFGRIPIGPRANSAGGADPGGGFWLAGQQAFALRALARQLARPADRFRPLARLLLGWFFVMAAQLHLAENPLALHLLLQRLEGLVDIVVANENLHVFPLGCDSSPANTTARRGCAAAERAHVPALRALVHRRRADERRLCRSDMPRRIGRDTCDVSHFSSG